MIARPLRLDDFFFRKHKKKKVNSIDGQKKKRPCGGNHDQINSQKYVFNERTSVMWKGKLFKLSTSSRAKG